MISACPRCALLGFAASALVHFAIASSILWQDETEKTELGGEHQVSVSLAMFAEPDGGDHHQAEDGNRTSKPESDPDPAPELEPEPAAEPAPALAPDPEPLPTPQVHPLPKPEPEVKPKTAPKPQPKAAPKPESKPEQKPKPKTKPKRIPKPGLKSKPETQPALQPSAGRGTGGGKSGSSSRSKPSARGGDKKNGARTKALEQEYLAGLRRAIAKKQRYPASARRRGDTGVVTVSFVIAQNGRISGARVDKSSGSSALDKAAVETLQRLGQYKPIPKAIGRTRWSLRVPIRFALE